MVKIIWEVNSSNPGCVWEIPVVCQRVHRISITYQTDSKPSTWVMLDFCYAWVNAGPMLAFAGR